MLFFFCCFCILLLIINFFQVGQQTVESSSDVIFKQEMPDVLLRVGEAAACLEQVTLQLNDADRCGAWGRSLIQGSRGNISTPV